MVIDILEDIIDLFHLLGDIDLHSVDSTENRLRYIASMVDSIISTIERGLSEIEIEGKLTKILKKSMKKLLFIKNYIYLCFVKRF